MHPPKVSAAFFPNFQFRTELRPASPLCVSQIQIPTRLRPDAPDDTAVAIKTLFRPKHTCGRELMECLLDSWNHSALVAKRKWTQNP